MLCRVVWCTEGWLSGLFTGYYQTWDVPGLSLYFQDVTHPPGVTLCPCARCAGWDTIFTELFKVMDADGSDAAFKTIGCYHLANNTTSRNHCIIAPRSMTATTQDSIVLCAGFTRTHANTHRPGPE